MNCVTGRMVLAGVFVSHGEVFVASRNRRGYPEIEAERLEKSGVYN